MNILILGGQGFIGSHLAYALLQDGHRVTLGSRNPAETELRMIQCSVIQCDFTAQRDMAEWSQTLRGFDLVINCIGVLTTSSYQAMEAVHRSGPKELFEICATEQIRLIHFSAIGADEDNATDYAQTKYALEQLAKRYDFPWVILRPSLVVARGSYGGTSFFRGMAALPLVPLVDAGNQLFQPIAMSDLIEVVRNIIADDIYPQQSCDLAGPEQLTIKQIMTIYKSWLGLGRAHFVRVPSRLCKLACRLGSLLKLEPLTMTSYKMLTYHNITKYNSTFDRFKVSPLSMETYLYQVPSMVQDRWHAKNYFFRVLLKLSLAFYWIVSGAVAYHPASQKLAMKLLGDAGIPFAMQSSCFHITTLWDIVLGLWLLRSRDMKTVLRIMLLTVFVYTLTISWRVPGLWLDPTGAVTKNITVILGLVALYLMREER